MRKLKHSKIKNTGILFELLSRQITSDIMADKDPNITEVVKKYFKRNGTLTKELELYRQLTTEHFNSKEKAEKFVDAIVRYRKTLNEGEIKKQKYNLIKEISGDYDINKFTKNKISDYKLLASIYKLFEYNEQDNPKDLIEAKYTVVEHLTRNKVVKPEVNMLKNEPKEIRILAQHMMIERFNKTYANLLPEQKSILRSYILDNTEDFKKHMKEHISRIAKEMKPLIKEIKSDSTKIKLQESSKMLTQMYNKRAYGDKCVTAVLQFEQLLHEVKKATE